MTNDYKIWASQGLPKWFERPKSRRLVQASLFAEDIHDVLAQLKVSPDELTRWQGNGWISFDSQTSYRLEPDEIGTLVFVRDMVRSGLPDALLRALFDQLSAPVNVDPDLIAFSFTHGWVVPTYTRVPTVEQCIRENVDDWLENLAETRQTDRLLELKDSIDYLLKKAGVAIAEEDEG
jgi:hypothetical protein